MIKQLQCGDKILDLTSPQVMGILNVTPDSFSDGGKFTSLDKSIKQVEQMLNEGASIIDVGGESTRPGAKEVTIDEELNRVVPVVEAIKNNFDVIVSIDTSKPEVILESAKAGAGVINDVRALQLDGSLEAAALTKLPVCLMHMQGQPKTMQNAPSYKNIVEEISDFFKERINACVEAGIDKEKILLDPGFGFGKTVVQNYQLLGKLTEFTSFDLPLLIGLSRKSMIGNLLNRPVEQRLAGSLSAAVLSVLNGAKIVRVHDVAETVDALKIIEATLKGVD